MKIMRHFTLTLIFTIAIVAVIAFSACSSKSIQDQQNSKVIRIGSILPLTGPIAAYGNHARNGQLRAIQHLNDLQSEFKFELVLEDGKGEGKEAITAFQKLRSSGIDIITAGSSAMCMPILPLARQDDVLYFPSASHPDINKEVAPLVYRHFVTAEQEAPLILGRISESGRGKTALVTVNDEFGKGFANVFNGLRSEFSGVEVVLDLTAERTETDFTVLVQRIKQIAPDNVVIVSYGRSAGSFVNKMREQKVDSTIYVSFSYLLTEAEKTALSNREIIAVTLDVSELDVKEATDFGTIYLIGNAVINEGSSDIGRIARYLSEVKSFNAQGLEITIQSNHDILPKVKLIELK
ncbi:MAG: ABC transporter substrate-binding protein [Acidobacteria bacterium]|nr:ABC transporter substrate-binding protein [Acidobacteriota bacterium]